MAILCRVEAVSQLLGCPRNTRKTPKNSCFQHFSAAQMAAIFALPVGPHRNPSKHQKQLFLRVPPAEGAFYVSEGSYFMFSGVSRDMAIIWAFDANNLTFCLLEAEVRIIMG